jgi:hypothetical protein
MVAVLAGSVLAVLVLAVMDGSFAESLMITCQEP